MPNGQWRGSTRRERLPANWPQLCAAAREQWGTGCYVCGHPRASETDHVQPGDNHDIGNLKPICGRGCTWCAAEMRLACHSAKSSSEGGQAAQAARPKRTRPAEAHPGLRR